MIPVHAESLPIDLLIGADRAGQFIASRVRVLMGEDLIPEAAAYAAVCTAVLDSDPWTLAETGQVWSLRPDVMEEFLDAGWPRAVYVVMRSPGDNAMVTIEDEDVQRAKVPLAMLAAYQLDQWLWAR
ncbi:hypothetical protein [Streptomyces sp. NPDC058701]|uniref:hypothetical protein n=1 Tax=Streptomyces sp. NPDC058701 TaxID=3346608 RepID=UPI003646B8BB